jgi:hypothetical protein
MPYICLSMRHFFLAFLLIWGAMVVDTQAQTSNADGLLVKVEDRGNNRFLIRWEQKFGARIRQVSIQRSFDSTKMFKTIITLPDPGLAANGYVDNKAPNDHMYYRLYILLDSGQYLFSPSQRPSKTVGQAGFSDDPSLRPVSGQAPGLIKNGQNVVVMGKEGAPAATIIPEKIFHIKRRDTLLLSLSERYMRAFKDSIRLKTKDTLLLIASDTFHIRPFIPREVYKPSKYVYTEREGQLRISLPDAPQKKYKVIIFELNGDKLFEINNIIDKTLTIDKSHFGHAGWFRFELFEDGVLKEKHRFQIARDF